MPALCKKSSVVIRADTPIKNGFERGVIGLPSLRGPYVCRKQAIQVGSKQCDRSVGVTRPLTTAEKELAPVCPVCGGKAKLVTRDELFPFREDRKIPDLFYACCGNLAPVIAKSLRPAAPLRGYVSRRLRREALAVFNQLTCAEFGFGRITAGAVERGMTWLRRELNMPYLDVSQADALTCHNILRVCYRRLADFGRRGGYGLYATNRRHIQ